MGFDKNSNQPPVNFRRWTTKVNLWMVVGVLCFLGIGALVMFYWTRIKPL